MPKVYFECPIISFSHISCNFLPLTVCNLINSSCTSSVYNLYIHFCSAVTCFYHRLALTVYIVVKSERVLLLKNLLYECDDFKSL